MTEHVKAGQVWQHKNSGRRVAIRCKLDANWMVADVGGVVQWPLPESIITDDYILVKDAP